MIYGSLFSGIEAASVAAKQCSACRTINFIASPAASTGDIATASPAFPFVTLGDDVKLILSVGAR